MVFDDEFSFCKPYLTEGEQVLWEGKPGKGKIFLKEDILMTPFSILWCSFAIFWTVTASSGGGFFGLFGVPFICVGLYLVFGRFFVRAYNRKRTFYVITNRKILRMCGRKVDMLEGRNIVSVSTENNKDGSGTVRFNENSEYSHMHRGNQTLGINNIFMLENIPDLDKALQAIAGIERYIY